MATTSETEVRKRHHKQKIEENEDAEVTPEETEPASEQEQEQGADYWDLDDDDQWASSAYSTSELAKRRNVLRRSNTEVGVAFVCHLVLMCYYIYVHVYDATIVKRSKGVGFDGMLTFGGRWKFLTYINLVSKLTDLISSPYRPLPHFLMLHEKEISPSSLVLDERSTYHFFIPVWP